MSSINVKPRIVFPAATAVVAAAVGIYAAAVSGHMTPSVIFLMIASGALGWVVWVAFRAAQSLTREPEAAELAVATGRRRKELEREKQALLKALKDLEFDHEMGKVSDSDYQEIGGNYRARAVRVMRQLDAQAGDVDYKTLVERDLAARVKVKQSDAPAAQEDARPKCAKCSTVNDIDAEFCKKCGNRLKSEAAS